MNLAKKNLNIYPDVTIDNDSNITFDGQTCKGEYFYTICEQGWIILRDNIVTCYNPLLDEYCPYTETILKSQKLYNPCYPEIVDLEIGEFVMFPNYDRALFEELNLKPKMNVTLDNPFMLTQYEQIDGTEYVCCDGKVVHLIGKNKVHFQLVTNKSMLYWSCYTSNYTDLDANIVKELMSNLKEYPALVKNPKLVKFQTKDEIKEYSIAFMSMLRSAYLNDLMEEAEDDDVITEFKNVDISKLFLPWWRTNELDIVETLCKIDSIYFHSRVMSLYNICVIHSIYDWEIIKEYLF